MAFTSHADAAFDVCFENILEGGRHIGTPSRDVELDIDIGADAKDWNAVQATEKLKPVETELRRIEELVGEIVTEMDYLRAREQKLRDTNESTNNRVKWFAFATMAMLIALGGWQIMYLRAYFRYAHGSSLQNSWLTFFEIEASHLDITRMTGRLLKWGIGMRISMYVSVRALEVGAH
jgi:hypothetical protein